jgi:hypothetical protein
MLAAIFIGNTAGDHWHKGTDTRGANAANDVVGAMTWLLGGYPLYPTV